MTNLLEVAGAIAGTVVLIGCIRWLIARGRGKAWLKNGLTGPSDAASGSNTQVAFGCDSCEQTAGQLPRPLRVGAAIPCGFAGCGQTAAMVELIPKGAVYADGQKDILHELDSVFSAMGTYRVSDFLPYVGYSLDVADYEAVVAAVRGADNDVAAMLYGRNKEYAPFFCAECGCSYCGTHWKLRPVFDEAGFDYYTGGCPVGHKKFIDH